MKPKSDQSAARFPQDRPRFYLLATLGIVAVAAALRFWRLADAPVWMDEAYTLLVARLPLHVILFDFIDLTPPPFYAIQHFWSGLASSPDLVRVPAAAIGVFGVGLVIAAVSDLVSPRAGLASGLLMALSTSHIWFSQDARAYTLLLCGLTLALWGAAGLNGAEREGRLYRYLVLYWIGALVAGWSQVIALAVLFALNCGWVAATLIERDRRLPRLRLWLGANLALAVLFIPLFIQIWKTAGAFAGVGSASPLTAPWFYRNAVGFAGLPKLPRLLGELLLVGGALLGLMALWRSGKKTLVLMGAGVMAIYPALLVLARTAGAPMMANRMFLPALIVVVLGAGAFIVSLRPKVGALAYLVLLSVVALASDVLEKAHRTEYENPPAALAYADQRGFASAPVLPCNDLSAASFWVADPKRAIFVPRPGGFLRFDGRYLESAALGAPRFYRATAAEMDQVLGGGYRADPFAAAPDKVVVVSGPCFGQTGPLMQDIMRDHGFHAVARQAFRTPEGQRVVMESGETEVTLYAR